ncbi:MAG: DNA repair protein RecN, partial [Pseudomonadota bacterium]
LKTSVHLNALDSFGELDAKRQDFAYVYTDLTRVREKLKNSRKDERERVARLEYLRYVTGELESAGLQVGEEDRLHEEETILAAAEKLRQAATTALEDIYQADGSAVEAVSRCISELRHLMETDTRLGEPVQLLEESVVQLEEAGHFLRDYSSAIQADPQRLDQIQERLAFLAGLKKRYGPSLEDVINTLEQSRRELLLLEDGEFDIEELRSQEAGLSATAVSLAEDLSRSRKEKALPMEGSVRKELRDLAMDKVEFSVALEKTEMSESGADRVEFLISPNPGEPLMPLKKIASGGELSRVMLALKRILAGAHQVSTLVFDEVDSGIGGRVAAVLGRKLQDIARYHQVLCITHLAPVAACADHHVVVEKIEDKGRTVVRTRYLEDEERVEELARMMGGIELSSGIVKSARELLEEARG